MNPGELVAGRYRELHSRILANPLGTLLFRQILLHVWSEVKGTICDTNEHCIGPLDSYSDSSRLGRSIYLST
jgi:hypothetical protein